MRGQPFRKLTALALAVSSIGMSGPAIAKRTPDSINPGPQPDFTVARNVAESTIKSSFVDPNSAEFQWPFDWVGGYWKPVLQGKRIGWWTCGLVNAKNRMGGYVGFQNFAVVFFNAQMIHFEVGNGDDNDLTNLACQKAARQGTLKPSGTGMPSVVALDPSKPALGIQVNAVPDGLYISAVTPGYPAAIASLQPGMVISAINGIILKGMPPTTAVQILLATSSDVILTIIGRGDVKMTKALPATLTQ